MQPFHHTYSHHHHHHRPAAVATASAAMFGSQNSGYFFNLNNSNNEDDNENSEDNHNNNEQQQQNDCEIPKVPLFEKPLTPSDVGKLNRLVIPKQHAERHFPMHASSASAEGEKCALLSFEDVDCGKSWRFRYSYWNSSQSYVLTKGWSRFVKDKRLDPGDVVFFERHRLDGNRLFIGWRRRRSSSPAAAPGGHPPPPATITATPYQQPNCLHAGGEGQTVPSGNSKRSLRLFGVNLECEMNSDEWDPNTPQQYSTGQPDPFTRFNHMDMNFSRDQMRYQQQG